MADEDQDQSIDDQAETASGGLTNDMPGLPMSPPRRGPAPPSALGGLAQAWQRMMGGQPPPQAARPGRSPWQAPGQSQLPVGPQGPQRPQGPQQRWQGTTASLFLPKGARQPPASFTPFMRVSPPTDSPMQWGQAAPDPYLPRPFEAPALYQNTSRFFGQNGSAAIIPIALSMGRNAGAFVKGIMDGQEWKAKMHLLKLKEDAADLEDKQQKELYTYFDTVDEYQTAKGVGNVSDVGNYAIKGVTLLDALGQEATKLGDDKLLAVLGTGSVDKAMNFLHERNNNWQTLKKTNAAAEKQDFDDALYGMKTPGSTTQPSDPTAPRQTTQPTAPSDPTAPRPTGAQAPQAAGPAPVDAQGNPITPTEDENQKLIDQAAVGMYAGEKPTKEQLGEHQQAMAYNRMLQMQRSVNAMLQDPKLKGNEAGITDRLAREINPEIAQQFRGVSDYDVNVGQNWNSRSDPLKAAIQNLAEYAHPGDDAGFGKWSAQNYQAQLNFKDKSQTQQTQLRVETVDSSGSQLVEALHALPDAASDPSAWKRFAALAPGAWSANPIFVGVQNAWLNYNMEKNALIRAGGGSVTQEQESRGIVPTALGSPAAYRTALTQDAGNAIDRVMATQNQWRGVDGKGMFPGFNPGAFRDLMKLANAEPNHELQPGQTIKGDDGVTRRWMGIYDPKGNKIPEDGRWETVR